jgi:hypothetical protein
VSTHPVEAQIAHWRAYLERSPAVSARDVEELEAHLRELIADLDALGLTEEETFLVAVKRMGEVDAISREFAREHSERLWKQLLGEDTEETVTRPGWPVALGVAIAAALTLQVARLVAGFPDRGGNWLARNIALLTLPFLAGFFAYRRRIPPRTLAWAALPFVVAAVVVNAYPFESGGATEGLVAAHLPVALWFAVGVTYVGGEISAHARRMDFVRFTGEWVVYYTLTALGGGVLTALTVLVLEPTGAVGADQVVLWLVLSGAAGAVVVSAWLVEWKQQVVENMAPVLTAIFTPLFAVMLAAAAITYAATGIGAAFDRDLLGVFDALLVVVLGLVLYSWSARDPARPAGWADRIQLATVMAALALDLLVLAAMVGRVGELGFTANRAAALGLNLVLLGNLAGAAYWLVRFLTGRCSFARLERWQTSYLPVLAAWAAGVVVVIPPLFVFA